MDTDTGQWTTNPLDNGTRAAGKDGDFSMACDFPWPDMAGYSRIKGWRTAECGVRSAECGVRSWGGRWKMEDRRSEVGRRDDGTTGRRDGGTTDHGPRTTDHETTGQLTTRPGSCSPVVRRPVVPICVSQSRSEYDTGWEKAGVSEKHEMHFCLTTDHADGTDSAKNAETCKGKAGWDTGDTNCTKPNSWQTNGGTRIRRTFIQPQRTHRTQKKHGPCGQTPLGSTGDT